MSEQRVAAPIANGEEAIVEGTKINILGHNHYCKCDKCAVLVTDQFQPFHIELQRLDRHNHYQNCPVCARPVWGRCRSSYILWSCWECNMSRGTISRVVTARGAHDTFGFGTDCSTEDEFYLHNNRHAEVIFDGSDHAALIAYDPLTDQLPTFAQAGDVVIYHLIIGERGGKALWWCLEDDYLAVKKRIAERPLYRFMKRVGELPNSKRLAKSAAPTMTHYELWKGKNVATLREEFSVKSFQVFENSSMALYFEFYEEESDIWIHCADPR